MKECGIPLSDSSLPAVGQFQCHWSACGRGSATSSESSLLIAMVTDSLAHPQLLSLVNTHTHTLVEIRPMNKSSDPTYVTGV